MPTWSNKTMFTLPPGGGKQTEESEKSGTARLSPWMEKIEIRVQGELAG